MPPVAPRNTMKSFTGARCPRCPRARARATGRPAPDCRSETEQARRNSADTGLRLHLQHGGRPDATAPPGDRLQG
ncbi:hypothetical protein JOB18_019186 [Solea senegalensis]|uniref:Uncharacterized protein n=1 Tax=Solea senegalensis TaxID=28829 RepID=A0AAV6RH88_SOLSE|nr:hypothetical protein JOB18_019186 [Solea senegalensis]